MGEQGNSSSGTLAEVWRKRIELREMRERCRELAAEIAAEDQARLRSALTQLGPHQGLVLKALGDDFHDEGEGWAFSFATIASMAGLNRLQVSRACKALRRLGFVKHCIGLWNEDGEVAGSGYAITRHGRDWLLSSEAPPLGCAGEAELSTHPGTNPKPTGREA